MTVVALGDSITRGRGGEPALGVHPQSWAQWLAEAMEQPFLNLATDGAVASDVLRSQVPRLARRYDLGLLYIGVNDVRAIVAALRERCWEVAVLTLPEDLGRPTAAPKPSEANQVLRALDGVVLVELANFGGSLFVLPDAVHPTSAGMVEIARRAARALRVPEPGPDDPIPSRGLRYRAWWGRLWARDVVRRMRERRTLKR